MFIAMKPVVWNPNGYVRPSGGRPVSDANYPEQYGFGHEEWNGSPALTTTLGDERFRVFHTEAVERASSHPGATLLFMYASHDRVQQLVGIAGRATYLANDPKARERIRADNRRLFGRLAAEVWSTPGVQERFRSSPALRKHWASNVGFTPAWIAPERFYLWLKDPVTIDATSLIGKSKFLTLFTRYTEIDIELAARLLQCIPVPQRTQEWKNIAADLFDMGSSAAADIAAIEEAASAASRGSTTVKTLIEARLGQGRFREQVLQKWGRACAVTGITTAEALRASHILAWSRCSSRERLDPHNGIPLVATLDALFDKHMISFSADGEMLISKSISRADRKRLGLGGRLRAMLGPSAKKYLSGHRAIHRARDSTLT